MEGYVYIARIIDHGGKFVNGYHKIGLSKQYKVRETQLNSTHLPFDVLMVRVFESEDMNKLEGAEKNNYFFDLWTLKESYLKLLGKGLTKALNTFTVRKSESGFTLEDTSGKTEKIYFRQYYPDVNHICSVCSFSDQFTDNLEILHPQNILEL